MENILRHIQTSILIAALLLGLLVTDSANATPKGPYLVAEAGFGYVNDNYLEGLDGVYTGQVVYASVQQTTRAQSSERAAFGYYLAHSDPIMAFGIEVGYNYFNQLDSSTSTSIASQSVTGHQQSSAWYTSLEEITSFDLCHAVNFFIKFGGKHFNEVR